MHLQVKNTTTVYIRCKCVVKALIQYVPHQQIVIFDSGFSMVFGGFSVPRHPKLETPETSHRILDF